MNGTLLLPLFIKLQSIRWLCTYVHLPSGLHVNKQISCGSNYTLKETFSSISTLEAHNTSSRVIILCIRLLYHLAKNFKTCKKIICQPFLERQEICHPKIKTIYYTIDQGKILIILMVLSYITFNALSYDVRIFLKLNQNISEYICLNLLNTLLSWLSCFWGIIFSPYEEMSSEYCYWKHLWCEEYIFYFNNKIRIMKSKKNVHVLININKHHLFKLNVE